MKKKFKPKYKGDKEQGQLKKNRNIAAVIDIGSNTIRLTIAQAVSGKVEVLEELIHPLSLGTDTFSLGKIQIDTLTKLCDVLLNFVDVIMQYRISNVRAIATTALREASNKDHIVDIIKTRTGLSVDIMNDVDDKSYIYRGVLRIIEEQGQKFGNSLMAYIGIGNLGVACYEDGKFPFMYSLRLGSLRLSELFENVMDYGQNYFTIVDEYQYGVIDDLKILMPDIKLNHFIACGSEAMFISSICEAEQKGRLMHVSKDKFLKKYEKIKTKTFDQLMDEYEITQNRAELLFPFMSMCHTLLSLTKAKEVIMPLVYLRDCVLYEELFPKEAEKWRERFDENVIMGARELAKRYSADLKHSNVITYFTLKIFDKLKKEYGFTQRDGLLLQAAAIMHDIGKFVNIKNHDDHAYNIISGSDISGLSNEETEIVACICKYNGRIPSQSAEYKRLTTKKRVLVSKLSAILGMAEALDRSHTQKFDDFDLTLSDNVLTLTITTYKDIMLEEWAFVKKSRVFEEIFGIKAEIKRKKVF